MTIEQAQRARKRWTQLIAGIAVLFLTSACSGDQVTLAPGPVETSQIADTGETPTLEELETPSEDAQITVVAENEDENATPAAAATSTPQRPPSPTPVVRPSAPNGRIAPAVATSPVELAKQLIAADSELRRSGASLTERADAGHSHQVAIRKLGYEPGWDSAVFEALPANLQRSTLLHVSARRALIDLSREWDAADFIPAWEIVNPEPVQNLIAHYQEAETATGIDWEYLAAINLVETGMGRIRGLSSAGAQGPMQFLPTTWDESGIGEGDINDPRDAINAAARYLVRRGGPDDMDGAIWGYNNSDDYVTAVKIYAELVRQDPSNYNQIYNWEIYFFTEAGDIWLPAGFSSAESTDLYEFLDANPWSAPDPGLR